MNSPTRRDTLKCLAFGGTGTLFMLSGGILHPMDLAVASESRGAAVAIGTPLFVQISDSHIGFNKDANPDVKGTLMHAIGLINAIPQAPAFVVHTGDITHLSKAEEFDAAQQLLNDLKPGELHTVPGEHDVADATQSEYFRRFGQASANRGYYSFDHAGVHCVALINVMNFKPGGLGVLGDDQLHWLEDDLRAHPSSTPVVIFAHMPLWTIYEPWGWGTGDSGRAMSLLRRFGSVTVLNGHIHQIVRKVEGNITFHTARATAYPQPAPGEGPGPGPLKVPPDRLASMLGVTSIAFANHPRVALLKDQALG